MAQSMPPSQVREFNRYIGLLNASHIHLSFFITVVELWTEQVYAKFFLMLTLAKLAGNVWGIAKLGAERETGQWRRSSRTASCVDLPWAEKDPSSVDHAEALYETVRETTVYHWQEVRAIESIIQEVAKE